MCCPTVRIDIGKNTVPCGFFVADFIDETMAGTLGELQARALGILNVTNFFHRKRLDLDV